MTTNESQHEQMETVRIGYQVAVNLFMYESNQVWSRFNIMVLANSILFGGIILILTSESLSLPERGLLRFLVWALSVGGLLLCGLWLWITIRGTANFDRYMCTAKGFEARLKIPIQILHAPLPQGVPVRVLSYLIIVLFGLGYVLLLVLWKLGIMLVLLAILKRYLFAL